MWEAKDNYLFYALTRPRAPCAGSSRRARGVYSSPAISGGVVYAGSEDKYIYALDAGTGTVAGSSDGLLRVVVPGHLRGSGLRGGRGRIHLCLGCGRGTLRWKFKTGDPVFSSPAVSGALVYTGSGDDYLYALK